MASAVGLLLGALVPAMVVAALSLDFGLFLAALSLTLGHALILGLPAVLLFHYKRWSKPAATVAAGFLIGAVPVGILIWPLQPGTGVSMSSSSGPTIIDGIPTWLGWLEYVEFSGSFGLLGALGALVFWVTLSKCRALPTDG